MLYRITEILFHPQSITVMILYNTICRHHRRPYKSFWYGIIYEWFDPRLSFQCCTKYRCFVDFGRWKACRPMYSVCYLIYWHVAAIFSDNKWSLDGIKTRNLRQQTNLLQKIAHHNNAHHPCPSHHQSSLFGKHTLPYFGLQLASFLACGWYIRPPNHLTYRSWEKNMQYRTITHTPIPTQDSDTHLNANSFWFSSRRWSSSWRLSKSAMRNGEWEAP